MSHVKANEKAASGGRRSFAKRAPGSLRCGELPSMVFVLPGIANVVTTTPGCWSFVVALLLVIMHANEMQDKIPVPNTSKRWTGGLEAAGFDSFKQFGRSLFGDCFDGETTESPVRTFLAC